MRVELLLCDASLAAVFVEKSRAAAWMRVQKRLLAMLKAGATTRSKMDGPKFPLPGRRLRFHAT